MKNKLILGRIRFIRSYSIVILLKQQNHMLNILNELNEIIIFNSDNIMTSAVVMLK